MDLPRMNGLSAPEVTASSYDTGTIVQSYIYFNMDMQDVSTTVGQITSYQVDVVTKHELGHVLGLRHTFEDGEQVSSISALMHPYYNQQSSTFQTYDYNELEKTYPQ